MEVKRNLLYFHSSKKVYLLSLSNITKLMAVYINEYGNMKKLIKNYNAVKKREENRFTSEERMHVPSQSD